MAIKLTAAPPGPTILASQRIEMMKVYPADVRPRLAATLESRAIPLTNRQMDQGLVAHYRLQAKVQDPLLAGNYSFTWKSRQNLLRPGSGYQLTGGGGPADDFIELFITQHGNYRFEVNVRDREGNSCLAATNLNIRLHDR